MLTVVCVERVQVGRVGPLSLAILLKEKLQAKAEVPCIVSKTATAVFSHTYLSISPFLDNKFWWLLIKSFLLNEIYQSKEGSWKTVEKFIESNDFWFFCQCPSDHFLFCASKASSLLWVVASLTFTFGKSLLVGLYCYYQFLLTMQVTLFLGKLCVIYIEFFFFSIYPRFFFMWFWVVLVPILSLRRWWYHFLNSQVGLYTTWD